MKQQPVANQYMDRWRDPEFRKKVDSVLRTIFTSRCHNGPVDLRGMTDDTLFSPELEEFKWSSFGDMHLAHVDLSFSVHSTNFCRGEYINVDLSHSEIDGSMAGSVFVDCSFVRSRFPNPHLSDRSNRSRFERCDFRDIRSRGRLLMSDGAERATFIECDFSNAVFARLEFRGCKFQDCAFNGANFRRCTIFGNEFIGTAPTSEQFDIECEFKGKNIGLVHRTEPPPNYLPDSITPGDEM